MSSHHIVREKQEPALLVLGLDNFDDEQLGQLLEWSPTLIATPIVAEQLNSLGIKIDWIITNDAGSDLQSDINHLPMGNNNVIASALKHLTAHGYPAVNVVTDEFDLADYMHFANKLNLVIFYQQEKIFGVTSGFSKWKPGGEEIRLLSLTQKLKTTGLEQTGELNYVTTTDGFFTLTFDTPLLFIAERL
jgi:thiamine pyrophosphokinase